jgi:hypothetical protein
MPSDKPELKTESPKEKMAEIVLRVPMSKKSAYVRAAKPGKLADWCVKALDEAAKGKSV